MDLSTVSLVLLSIVAFVFIFKDGRKIMDDHSEQEGRLKEQQASKEAEKKKLENELNDVAKSEENKSSDEVEEFWNKK